MNRFKKTTPEKEGIHSEGILAFIECMKRESIELHSLAVMRHGKLLYESWWSPYDRETPHIMFSFSKSLTSTAIGFAEQEGILSLDEKLVDIFPDKCPEDPSENLKKADLWSLLTMSCGHATEIDWASPDGDPDWIRAFLHNEFRFEPGTNFMYNTAGTNMLAAVLAKKTGLQVTEFLKPRLFDKIGMSDIQCLKMADGTEMGGAGMFMTLEDMERFGMFLLKKGKWGKEQLLNRDWFKRAASKQVDTVSEVSQQNWDNWAIGYGFQFWMCKPEKSFRADGAYGQFALVFPKEDLLIVVNSASFEANTLINAAYDTILKDMDLKNPLPISSFANAALKILEQKSTLPALWGVRTKASEAAVEGVIYQAAPGTMSFTDFAGGSGRAVRDNEELKSLSFRFDADRLFLHAVQGEHEDDLEIGLAGQIIAEDFMGGRYGASAMWLSENELLAEVRCARCASGARLTFTFTEDGLRIDRRNTLPAAGLLLDCGGTSLTLYKA